MSRKGPGPTKRKKNHNYASRALRYHPKRVARGTQRSWSKRRKGGYTNGA